MLRLACGFKCSFILSFNKTGKCLCVSVESNFVEKSIDVNPILDILPVISFRAATIINKVIKFWCYNDKVSKFDFCITNLHIGRISWGRRKFFLVIKYDLLFYKLLTIPWFSLLKLLAKNWGKWQYFKFILGLFHLFMLLKNWTLLGV